MTSLWPGGDCEFCEFPDEKTGLPRHGQCVGWAKSGFGFCGCARDLCGVRLRLRLLTGVLWDVQAPPNHQGET